MTVDQLIRFIVANSLLAVVYVLAGQMTQALSIVPSGAVPLWAPTGIMLAAVLIWGYRLLPGVFLGDFVIAFDMVGFSDQNAILMCLFFGLQAAFQAGVGRYLLVYFRAWPTSLLTDKSILLFFALAGVISSLLPAIFIVVVELLLGVLTAETWFETFIVWWLGNALGVVIFTPIMLILFSSTADVKKQRIYSFVIPMTVLFLALLVIFYSFQTERVPVLSYYWLMSVALLVSALMAIWLLTLTGREKIIKTEVETKTKEISLKADLLAQSEEKYRCLVENIRSEYFIYSYDKQGVYNYISPSVETILGYQPDEFLTHYLRYLANSDINRCASENKAKSLEAETVEPYELEIVDKQGNVRTFKLTESPVCDKATGEVTSVEGIARDITHSKHVQLELEKLSLAMKHSPNAVIITDRDGLIEYVNPKFTTVTGFEADEVIGKWPDILSSGDTDPSVYKAMRETLLSGCEWRGELKNCKKNGDVYWAQELVAPMLDESGGVSHFIITQEDITEARQLNERTSYQASHDLLTGLINRHEFESRLTRAINSSKRDLTEHALCYLDLDQFKVVNDTCGHVAGDELLRQIGGLMLTNVRSRDTLARLGGDEFALLMEHCEIDQAHQACVQLIELLQGFRFHWEEHVFTLGVSIGLTIIDQHVQDSEEAMKFSDSACYEAKNEGRNQIHIHVEDHDRLQKRRGEIQWSSEISNALDNERLILYAQPIVSISDSTLCIGYEVLVRMTMPDGRVVPPGAFLPAAERYNSATRIDRWVVSHTLHWLSQHAHKLPHLKSMSINLSGQSLGDETMLDYIIHEIDRGKISAEKIKFEITETAAIANLRDATVFINTLKEFGCRFALDDFGSGLSSFAYLKNLNVDTLKIDGMFVRDMLDDSLDFEMVKSINDIGHVMGLETVAEFVENDAVLSKLREIGVDYAQGYSLGKPVAIDELLK